MNIYPEDQVDENFFDLYYQPFKKQIWGVGLLIAITTVTYLGVKQMRKNQLEDQWSRYGEAREVQPTPPGQTPDVAATAGKQAENYLRVAADFPDSDVTPFALKGAIDAQVAAKNYAGALESIDELQSRFPDFAMNALPASPGDTTVSLSEHLRKQIEREQAWDADTAYEHRWPSEERKACIETNQGTFWIGFYEEDAPEHVAAFIENAKAGEYNGTQVYAVRQAADGSPQLFRAGSEASKSERDPAEHDRDEPLDTIEHEDARYTIRHVKRVVSAVEMDSGESATRFQVILAPEMTRYNGQNTPFAAVLDQETSLDSIEKIGRAETYATNPETAEGSATFLVRDNPYPSIYIRRVTILTNEKIEDGHTWDTSRALSADPEPWEAERKPDPKPEEFTDGGDESDAAPGSANEEEASDEGDDSEDEKPGEEDSESTDNEESNENEGDADDE